MSKDVGFFRQPVVDPSDWPLKANQLDAPPVELGRDLRSLESWPARRPSDPTPVPGLILPGAVRLISQEPDLARAEGVAIEITAGLLRSEYTRMGAKLTMGR